jgi:hypothetical protein
MRTAGITTKVDIFKLTATYAAGDTIPLNASTSPSFIGEETCNTNVITRQTNLTTEAEVARLHNVPDATINPAVFTCLQGSRLSLDQEAMCRTAERSKQSRSLPACAVHFFDGGSR